MKLLAQFEKEDQILVAKLVSKDISKATRRDYEKCFGKILKRFKKGYKHLILNFEGVGFIRSVLVGQLIWLHKYVEVKDRKLVIINAPPSFMDIFEVVGVDKVIRIYPTLSQAIEYLKGKVRKV